MYADDLCLIHFHKNGICEQHLQQDLEIVASHLLQKKLTINPLKSKLLTIKRNNSKSVNDLQLSICNMPVQVVDSVKYLGVILDSNLDYSLNSIAVASRVKKHIGYIHRTCRRVFLPTTLSSMFKILLRVVLLYATEPTYPINIKDRVRLERVQKFACRLFLGNWNRHTPYLALYTPLNLTPLWHTVFTRRLILIHSYVLGCRHIPPNIINLISNSNIRSSHRTNHTNALLIPKYKLNRSVCSSFITSISAYNLLPLHVVSLNIKQFRIAIIDQSLFNSILNKLKSNSSKIVTVLNV